MTLDYNPVKDSVETYVWGDVWESTRYIVWQSVWDIQNSVMNSGSFSARWTMRDSVRENLK